jgi:hypothetical protein
MTVPISSVSVIIPVYNTGLWTCDALDSVLAQTWPAHEILVVDDGSDPPTAALLDRAAAAHPGLVRVVRHDVNRGVSAARNTALRVATGDLIVFLDPDDMLSDPGVLADVARRHARTGFDMARLRLEFWKHNPVTGAERRWPDVVDGFIPVDLSGVTAAQVPALFQTRANWQFVYRRKFIIDEGIFYDEALTRREDRPFLNHALLKARRIDLTSRLGFFYRQRPGSIMHEPKVEDLALYALGVETARARIRDAGQARGPARFILDLHYLTGLHGLIEPFLKSGEEDAARAMLVRFRAAMCADLPDGHPASGPEAEAAFALWPEASEQSVFPPSVTRELACGWLAHLHARLLEGADAALDSLWAASGEGARAGIKARAAIAGGALPIARAAADAREAAFCTEDAPAAQAAPALRGARRPKLLLHIGLTKTGSTYLQNFWELNAARMLDRGVLYPETGIYREPQTDRGSGHNMALREVFMDGPRPTLTALREEILASGARAAIVSCENLSWNADWRNPAGVRALSRAFEGFDVSVLMVVRDEYDWLVSMYKEAVAGGWLRFCESPAAFFRLHEALGSIDFEGILAGYAAIFGAQNCHALDLAGEGDLARRALAILDPVLAEDAGLLDAPRANLGTPDDATAALRLLNHLPSQGQVDRNFVALARGIAPPSDDSGPRIDAMLDALGARRAGAGRSPWTAEEREACAIRLRMLWGSVDLRHASTLLTDRIRWTRPAIAAQEIPAGEDEAPAPETPIALVSMARMLDHAAGEKDRRLRRFGGPRPYGFSIDVDVDAAVVTLEADAPLGALRLIWGSLDAPEGTAAQAPWVTLPDDACAAALPIARRRFATHAMLTIIAWSGPRKWRREVLFALEGGAPVAIVVGDDGGDAALDLAVARVAPAPPEARGVLADLPRRARGRS